MTITLSAALPTTARIAVTADALGTTALVIVLVVLVLTGVAGVVFWAIWKRFRGSAVGEVLVELNRQIRSGERQLESSRPKSLGGADSIYAPMIAKDFPSLNIDEMKGVARRVLLETLDALSAEDAKPIAETDRMYIDELENEIDNNRNQGIAIAYENPVVHNTVITDYQRKDGFVRVTFRSGFRADYTKRDAEGKLIGGNADEASELRAMTSMIYIQDLTKLEGKYHTAYSANCPNCGAPLEELGSVKCRYCGSPLDPVHIKVWKFNDYAIEH